jgi:hypothetical protein
VLQHVEAAGPAHPHVRHDDVDPLALELADRLGAVQRRDHPVPRLGQRRPEVLDARAVVVHDQHADAFTRCRARGR